MDWLKELVVVTFGFALGFISQRYWDHISQKREKERQTDDETKEDKRLLLEVRKILLEIERMWKSSSPARPLIDCMDELSQLSTEIRREENKTIKIDIWQFSARFRFIPSLGAASKEMRREVEELKKKIEQILGIVKIQGGGE
jgi:predicted RNase H-like nuclease (RuvC/YqgF family)